MGHSEVVNHQYVSFLPAVEHDVLPDHVTDVVHVPQGDLGAIAK